MLKCLFGCARAMSLAVVSLMIMSFATCLTAKDIVPTDANCAMSECVIPYKSLSSQDTDPFLFLGRVVDQDHPQWRIYGTTIKKFPTVQSCLMDEEQSKTNPNIMNFDWTKMETLKQMDVCLFRVAASIDDLGQFRSWLRLQGFILTDVSRNYHDEYTAKYETETIQGFSAKWSVDELKNKTSIQKNAGIIKSILLHNAHKFSIGIGLSENMKVVDIQAFVSTK